MPSAFVKRPGFIRLMNALKPRPFYQILIMSEESRLGRESIETAYALKQIIDADVRLFFYLEDRERLLESATDKVMLALTNFASEMGRERAKQRTYDAMLRKAKAGHVTGGKVFGYDNREMLSAEGHRLHVVRVVNQQEAAIIRKFTTCMLAVWVLPVLPNVSMPNRSPPLAKVAEAGLRQLYVRSFTGRCTRVSIVWNQHQKIVRGGTRNVVNVTRRIGSDSMQRISASFRLTSGHPWR